jgi:hypothetical protein
MTVLDRPFASIFDRPFQTSDEDEEQIVDVRRCIAVNGLDQFVRLSGTEEAEIWCWFLVNPLRKLK